jgi:hypothetical protein
VPDGSPYDFLRYRPTHHLELVRDIRARGDWRFNKWELAFLESLGRYPRLSKGQWSVLSALYVKAASSTMPTKTRRARRRGRGAGR